MRGRSDGGQKKRLITAVCAVAIVIGFLYAYYGSSNRGSSALEYGKSLRRLGTSYLGTDEDGDGKQEESTKFGLDDGEDDVVPKSFPVSFYSMVNNVKNIIQKLELMMLPSA